MQAAALAALALILCSAAARAQTSADTLWPDRAWLVCSLTSAIPDLMARQDHDSGRFLTRGRPWSCEEQNVLLPLAAAWSLDVEGNPYVRDPELLACIVRGGNALVDTQDELGRWPVAGVSPSGRPTLSHVPWTYSRWVRTYALVRTAMAPEDRARWDATLQRGYRHVRHLLDGPVDHMRAHHAMGLFIAGEVFAREEWRRAARGYLQRVAEAQTDSGYWPDHQGPCVGYNHVYVDALGVFFARERQGWVLQALSKAARFHSTVVWRDGSTMAAIDGRDPYRPLVTIGNPGFSYTPEGRAFLLHQTERVRRSGTDVAPDYAASMLLYGGRGNARSPILGRNRTQVILQGGKALVHRQQPWQFCLSGYHGAPVDDAQRLDRQNLLDVFHDVLGLVAGGGNTKLQPYWSTFTIGNADLIRYKPSKHRTNFVPKVPLLWTPTEASVVPDVETPQLRTRYGMSLCTLTPAIVRDDALALRFSLGTTADRRVEAHLPLLRRKGRLQFANGTAIYLSPESVQISRDVTGGSFTWDRLRVTMPPGSRLIWPAKPFTPPGHETAPRLRNARAVLCVPLTSKAPAQTVLLSYVPPVAVPGLSYRAGDVPVISPTGTRLRRLEQPDCLILCAQRPSDAMSLTLEVPAKGRYELFVDFLLHPHCGKAKVAVNGTQVGAVFDAYAPELDASGPVSFGAVDLPSGKTTVSLQAAGRSKNGTRFSIAIRQLTLHPLAAPPVRVTPAANPDPAPP